MTWRDRLTDVADAVGGLALALAALPLAALPAHHWQRWPRLPIDAAAVPAGIATAVIGIYVWGRGFLAYAGLAAAAVNTAVVDAVENSTPGSALAVELITSRSLQGLSVLSVLSFTLATPLGWLAGYLILSGLLRAISAGVGQPFGDFLLTGIDAIGHRRWQLARVRARRRARERQEGPDVGDRLITGEACGLPGTDVVVIASRQKADWSAGTIVVTPDAWYRLGEPFDVEWPQGLRTAYPLTRLETNEVLRRGVPYALPPLQRASGPLRRP